MIKFFTGKVLAEQKSKYAGVVKVIDQYGTRKIEAGGLLQSGSIIKQLWQKPLKKVQRLRPSIENVLLLGLGGGTVVKLLNKQYHQPEITAIEIDPVMIEFGNQYFDLDQNQNLQVVCADAFHWIKKCSHKYDLILVDIFAGGNFPDQLAKYDFLQSLGKIASQNTIIVINCLYFDQYKSKTKSLLSQLDQHFTDIQLVRSLSNLFAIISIKEHYD